MTNDLRGMFHQFILKACSISCFLNRPTDCHPLWDVELGDVVCFVTTCCCRFFFLEHIGVVCLIAVSCEHSCSHFRQTMVLAGIFPVMLHALVCDIGL
jgi:hypothetical protein